MMIYDRYTPISYGSIQKDISSFYNNVIQDICPLKFYKINRKKISYNENYNMAIYNSDLGIIKMGYIVKEIRPSCTITRIDKGFIISGASLKIERPLFHFSAKILFHQSSKYITLKRMPIRFNKIRVNYKNNITSAIDDWP